MIADYGDFCETVERVCVTSWRSTFGRDCPQLDLIDSVLVTHRIDDDGNWVFSFAVRCNGAWSQSKKIIEPPDYDLFSKAEDNKMPHRVASELADDMVYETAKQMGVIGG